MNKTYNIVFFILVGLFIFSLGAIKSFSQVTNIDGNTYKTVIIGTQEWMAENLNVEHYCNGDIIPQVQDKDEWKKLTTGAWCYYENNSENGKTYGKLYNWYAVNDSRGLAPKDWHIPNYAEWRTLIDYLGGIYIAGGKLKATILWESPNEGATNESEFTAYPGGGRGSDGRFELIGKYGFFWSSWMGKYYDTWGLRSVNSEIRCYGQNSNSGFSVRCVRD